MRIPVNLASEPFRRDRPILAASIALSAILGLLLLGQVWMIVIQREQAKDARVAIAALEREMAALDREQGEIGQILRRADNAAALDRTILINQLLRRKGISWTRIFSDLETVVPYNVRVISVRPQVVQENDVVLDLLVGSQTAEPVIDMLMKLESSPVFGKTAIANWLPPTQSEPIFRYRLTVNYAQKL